MTFFGEFIHEIQSRKVVYGLVHWSVAMKKLYNLCSVSMLSLFSIKKYSSHKIQTQLSTPELTWMASYSDFNSIYINSCIKMYIFSLTSRSPNTMMELHEEKQVNRYESKSGHSIFSNWSLISSFILIEFEHV